jgi:hypothetical protein
MNMKRCSVEAQNSMLMAPAADLPLITPCKARPPVERRICAKVCCMRIPYPQKKLIPDIESLRKKGQPAGLAEQTA